MPLVEAIPSIEARNLNAVRAAADNQTTLALPGVHADLSTARALVLMLRVMFNGTRRRIRA
ncbi:hypothetical protein [Streptomyces sp. NBC_00096]|uniref:hypothetical protein n=1 Tax=Streptomyces sp. NBC_00096 TaxID=2975650 RepID=UPI00324445A6